MQLFQLFNAPYLFKPCGEKLCIRWPRLPKQKYVFNSLPQIYPKPQILNAKPKAKYIYHKACISLCPFHKFVQKIHLFQWLYEHHTRNQKPLPSPEWLTTTMATQSNDRNRIHSHNDALTVMGETPKPKSQAKCYASPLPWIYFAHRTCHPTSPCRKCI